MNVLRTTVVGIAALLLAGGYMFSQYAYFFGDPAKYVQSLDASLVPVLSLALLVGCVALAFVRDGSGEPQ